MSAPRLARLPALTIPAAVTWRDVDADLVLFDTRDGRYHALDRVASRIWGLIAEYGSIDRIVEQLEREYADAESVAADVREFVTRAVALGLIENEAGSTPNAQSPTPRLQNP